MLGKVRVGACNTLCTFLGIRLSLCVGIRVGRPCGGGAAAAGWLRMEEIERLGRGSADVVETLGRSGTKTSDAIRPAQGVVDLDAGSEAESGSVQKASFLVMKDAPPLLAPVRRIGESLS